MISIDLLIELGSGMSIEVRIESIGALSETGINIIPAILCCNYKK
jgi:hypothetical protein